MRGLVFGLIGVSWASGCRCSEPEPAQLRSAPVASASSLERCVEGPARLTVDSPGQANSGEDRDAPFAVEVGRTEVLDGHYVVPFLRGDGTQIRAGAVRLTPALEPTWIELGQVHGNSATPKVARLGSELLIAVPDADASGGAYRLHAWSNGVLRSVTEVDERGDDSPAFDLAGGQTHGALVFDDWDPKAAKSRIHLAAVSAQAVEPAEPVVVSPAGTDAEAPRVLAHPAGFWIVWVALGAARQPSDDGPLLVSERWLELSLVDARGTPRGSSIRLTEPDGHVSGYDVVGAHDGRLLVAVRDDGDGASSDSPHLRMIRVSAQGDVDSSSVEVRDADVAVPSLSFDPDPKNGAPHGWLALASSSGLTTFAGLMPQGSPLEELSSDPKVGHASLLAALGGQLLLAHPRGRDMVLQTVSCRPQTQNLPVPAEVPDAGALDPE
jgi:hypothetical protein